MREQVCELWASPCDVEGDAVMLEGLSFAIYIRFGRMASTVVRQAAKGCRDRPAVIITLLRMGSGGDGGCWLCRRCGTVCLFLVDL